MLQGLSSLLQMGGPSRWGANPAMAGRSGPVFSWMPRGAPAHYPGAFNPQPGRMQPSWGANPQPIGAPVQFPIGAVPHPTSGMQMPPGAGFGSRMPQQRYPQFNSQMNPGAQSQMMRSARPY
jgi:hypothetical protein